MEYIYIGKIVNTHGIKGEIRLISNFDKKDLVFKKDFKIYIGPKKDERIINTYRQHKNFDMITLYGINDINDVLKYKGLNVYINREDLNLKEEDYLIEDLIGLQIYCDGKSFGTVIDVVATKKSLLLKVDYQEKQYYIPYIPEFIKKVNIKDKKLEAERVSEFL